jgi:hypothetical protein
MTSRFRGKVVIETVGTGIGAGSRVVFTPRELPSH